MTKKDKQKEKQDRLARALRDNLKRRKQQTPEKARTAGENPDAGKSRPDEEKA